MARGRMLDEGFLRSRKLNSITRDCRLIYASILIKVDRQGRQIAEPIWQKATTFRHSDFTIEEIAAGMRTLAKVGLIRLYADAENAAIFEIVDFLKYNTPNHKEAASIFPGHEDPKAMPVRDPLLVADDETPMPGEPPGGAPRQAAAEHPPQAEACPGNPLDNGTERNVLTKERKRTNPPTPLAKPEPPASELVEAPPRRASRTKTGSRTHPKFDPATIPLPTFISPDVWHDWVAHRHKLRKTLTERAVELILADLAKTPLDADEMLRTSIKRGWTGVFPLDRNQPRPASAATDTTLDQYTARGL